MTRSILIAMTVLTVTFSAAVDAHAGRAQLGGSIETADQAYIELRDTISGSSIDSGSKSELLALADQAYASRSQYERFLAATTDFSQTLVNSSASGELSQTVLDGYNEALQAEEIEYEILPSLFKKCDSKFNCTQQGQICVKIIWHHPNGGGGVNCVSPTTN